MTHHIAAPRGMEDILPGEIEKWQWLEEKARIFLESRGFKEIRTPVLEYAELFLRSVGEASDIVHKQMFSLEDRGGRQMTLRPEATASVARAVLESGLLTQNKFLRLYYMGPMFRAERPQAGRKRQFHQIGIEIVNDPDPATDLECIRVLCDFLAFTGLKKFKLRLNDLGRPEAQKKMAQSLKVYFSKVSGHLCEDCKWRLEKNVLRIFDCKNESCRPWIEKAPWDEIAPLSESFVGLGECLKALKIPFEVSRRLVRGLDYYNGVVFEVAAEGLGAQDAVAGGGRYDRLYTQLGGSDTFCTGFSIGVERLIMAIESGGVMISQIINEKSVYIAPLEAGPEADSILQEAALSVRSCGMGVELLKGETSLSKHLKKANQLGLRWVLILGSEELAKGVWVLKDMTERTQRSIPRGELAAHLCQCVGLQRMAR